MTNFQFLANNFQGLYKEAVDAEKHTLTAPKYAALLCRVVLEKAVRWMYDNDPELTAPYDDKLSALIHEQCFREMLSQNMFREIDLIRLNGNNAAHGKAVSKNESLVSLKALFRFLSFFSKSYSETNPEIAPFDETRIPDGTENEKTLKELKAKALELEGQAEKLKQERDKTAALAKENELLKLQLDKQKAMIQSRREERKKLPAENRAIPELIPESVTRKVYINLLLKEAGWDVLRPGRELEYEVFGMPESTNPTGIGYADYVLWGNDGLPLAVIEAKRTSVDAHKGRHQAELYANCLEKMTGRRPVIFYTNGIETHLWDDTFYPERQVAGFYTKDELQLLIDRRKTRLDLRKFQVDTAIAGRHYQLEAIKRVAETLVTDYYSRIKGRNRKALLVMATGSGKTRVSAAIVDMLVKCNWVKKVLFLADRNALVTQAKNAFKEYLPNLTAVDLTKEKENKNTRLVFSTYPTIMNMIDSVKNEQGRYYGPGHFDLIIIDEAHRSVYQKYRAIFEYFDALLIGLTATPKTEVDRNTYSLFDIEDDNPTFAYELTQAVHDKYLVPPKAMSVPVKFPREGVKYNELSETEKAEYEEKFGDPTTGEAADEIESNALFAWLFNTDTVDKILDYLMTNGLKTHGGDRLGKTIVFARNHAHALFIEERFNKNYPEYSGKFLRVIDNYENKAQSLLESFCLPNEEIDPQIAVSVDMMDTGVDAPRVVNLVFFKPVKSSAKFWQMIGRGTRLCPNLFEPGKDKAHFLIFDFCENLEYFNEFPEGVSPGVPMSLSQQVFNIKLEIVTEIRSAGLPDDHQALAAGYVDELHNTIASLDHDRFVVRRELRLVNEFTNRDRWENISKGDFIDIANHLSGLAAPSTDEDELAKRFDMISLKLQLAIIKKSSLQRTLIEKIGRVGRLLMKKKNIPAVFQKIETIKAVQTDEFWQNISLPAIEQVRIELRDLIKFIDTEEKKNVYTHFEDEIHVANIAEFDILPAYTNMQNYRDRVESFIRKNRDFLVIHKIKNNIQITTDELNLLEKMLFADGVGSKTEYLKEYGNLPLGKFVRSILGLERSAANMLFAGFIQAGNLSGDQITFINNIIDFLTKNGTIDKTMLFEPPFTHINDQGITGVFDDVQVGRIIKIIDEVNVNAVQCTG